MPLHSFLRFRLRFSVVGFIFSKGLSDGSACEVVRCHNSPPLFVPSLVVAWRLRRVILHSMVLGIKTDTWLTGYPSLQDVAVHKVSLTEFWALPTQTTAGEDHKE